MNVTTQKTNLLILLVDDEPVLHDWVSEAMDSVDSRIRTASSASEAVEIFAEEPVDVIVTDSTLPDEDGVTLLTRVRAEHPDVVCILVPENGDADLLARAVNRAEVDHILRTPWQSEAVLAALQHSRRKLHQREEHRQISRRYHAHARELEARVEERTRELTLVIDQLEQRNEKLETTYQQLVQSDKMASLGLMAGTLAHDISNPLFVMEGTLELLESRIMPDQKAREYLSKVHEQIGRIEELVNSIRNYSRKSAGKYTKVNLIDVIEESLQLTKQMLGGNEIDVTTHFPEMIPFVYGNKNQLEQVMLNLIQNGVQAMDKGGNLTIELVSREEDDPGTPPNWSLTVSDTGCGIPAEKLHQVFNAFYTTREEGTGLGLNICQRIVREHRGDITVDSIENRGSTFVITVPHYEAVIVPENGRVVHE